MRYFVTGATGFIGSHLVRKLKLTGNNFVRGFDNLSHSKISSAECVADEFVRGDVRDAAELRVSMEGCNVVIHLAAESSVTGAEHSPLVAHEVNATGTFNVLRTASELGVRRVVVASSREVYGEVDD